MMFLSSRTFPGMCCLDRGERYHSEPIGSHGAPAASPPLSSEFWKKISLVGEARQVETATFQFFDALVICVYNRYSSNTYIDLYRSIEKHVSV